MGRQWNQIIESLGPLTGGTMSINANLTDIEALLTTLQADVADGIVVSSGSSVITNGTLAQLTNGTATVSNVSEIAGAGYTSIAELFSNEPVYIARDNSNTLTNLKTDASNNLLVSGTVTADSNRGSLTAASTQSITTGGTHQQVFASNASRKFLLVQNLSDTDMYLGIGFNPSNTTPDGILLSKSGGGIVFESSYIPTQEIRIVCATTGKRFEALEA